MNSRERFCSAARCRPCDRPPVWLMRQAGRYLPEYRAFREKYDFFEIVRKPELAVEVSLQPWTRFGMDAVIFFSDILTPLPALGVRVAFEEGVGPSLDRRFASAADLERLSRPRLRTSLPFTFETIEALRNRLGDKAALLGFVGAPWTIACYMIEGGSGDFSAAVAMARDDPDLLRSLLDFLTDVIAEYAVEQLRSGADAIQLFDTWGGLLGPDLYADIALPCVQRICQAVREASGIAILFIRESGRLLEEMRESGAQVISVGPGTKFPEAWRILGDGIATQGNLDPELLLGSPASVVAATEKLLAEVAHRPGHIVNLGHGVMPKTRPECVGALVETVKKSVTGDR